MAQEKVTSHEECIMRTISVVPYATKQLSQARIKEAVLEAEQNYRGWPVLSLWSGKNEEIQPDGLVCSYKSDDLDTILYWKIGRSGKMLHVFRLCWHEDRDIKSLAASTIVIELAEFLATICNLYRRLEFPVSTVLEVNVQYDNVKDALIPVSSDPLSLSNVRHDTSRKFQYEPIDATRAVPISTLPEQVGPHVHFLFRNLIDPHTTALDSFDEIKVTEWSLKTVQRRL